MPSIEYCCYGYTPHVIQDARTPNAKISAENVYSGFFFEDSGGD